MPIEDNLLEMIRRNNLFGGNIQEQIQPQRQAPLVPVTPFGSGPPTTPGYNPSAPWDHLYPDPTGPEDNISPIGRMNDSFVQNPSLRESLYSSSRQPVADDDIASVIERLYKPEHKYSDMYDKTMSEKPIRNKPGFGRKLAASLVGLFGGPAGADATMYGGYNRKVADWKQGLDVLEPALREERATNINNRTLATSTGQAILGEKRIAQADKKNEAAIANQKAELTLKEKDTETRRIRALAYDYAQRNPNSKFEHDINGDLIAIDPQTNIAERVVDPQTGKAVNTGDLGDAQKLGIQLANAKTLEGLRQTNRVAIKSIEQQNREKQEKLDQEGRMALITERARVKAVAKTEDKRLSVGQDAAAWKLAREQHIADNPHHRVFWDKGEPSDDAIDSDNAGEYEKAMTDIRVRYNRIKGKATPNSPVKPAAVTPPPPTSEVKELGLYDKSGKRIGNIRDTPAQRKAAADKGYTVK